MTEVEKIAKSLNDNMVKTMTWWSKGGTIQCDVSKTTQNALVKRGLAYWPPYEELCAELTDLGFQVQKYLNDKARAEQDAKDRALAEKSAAERKLREEGEKVGRHIGQADCVRDLYRAVYGNDTWPDRPQDTIWDHLIEKVRGAFGQEEVA